ncbi:unnamed protein product [Haemonchus placei]|uniref:Acyl_transf_3 domain-containing protein n=1 Tax=Haemonchus placei TaxID=6290 RepID=A0A158QL72_HAEPC|nr:unnamed protein product [Haemonchus placei]
MSKLNRSVLGLVLAAFVPFQFFLPSNSFLAYHYTPPPLFTELLYQNRMMMAIRLLLTFSFYANANSLLDTREPKEGTIRSLASIRFISMTWVAAGHSLLPYVSSDALLPVLSLWNPLLATTFTNAFLSVDTFFLLSGILVAYLFFKVRPPSKVVKNPLTWIMFYVHRYLRLTPPIMMFIGFYTVMSPFLKGPWMAAKPRNSLDANAAQACQKYWWQNMLYINNFFGMRNECYPITWYLAVDTQLYVSAPLFLISFYISPIIGKFLSAELESIHFFFDIFYQKPWTRCPPYLIGIGVGYLLAKLKGRKPKISWVGDLIHISLRSVTYILLNYSSKFVRATYNNFSRIGWSLAVSWVIVANHLGWGGPIARFMDHPLWQPLGRLSYCAYIVHFFIIQYVFNLDDRPTHYVSIWQSYVYRAIPIVVLSYIMAFIWSCLFEVSTTKLEKMLLEGLIPETRTHVRPIVSTTGELRIQEGKREV